MPETIQVDVVAVVKAFRNGVCVHELTIDLSDLNVLTTYEQPSGIVLGRVNREATIKGTVREQKFYRDDGTLAFEWNFR